MQNQSRPRVPWNKGKLVSQKSPADPAANPVFADPSRGHWKSRKPGVIQARNRQQASSLRSVQFKEWTRSIGPDPSRYGTPSMRRTKTELIYRQAKNLRAVKLLLGHTKLDSIIRHLGIEIDDALEISEGVGV